MRRGNDCIALSRSYDVYDPKGEWYENGYFDENDEWCKESGYFDNDGGWQDLDEELRKNLPKNVSSHVKVPGSGRWGRSGSKNSRALPPMALEDRSGGILKNGGSQMVLYDGAESKYAVGDDHGGDGKQRKHVASSKYTGSQESPKEQDGKIVRVAGAEAGESPVYNDVMWGIIFMAMVTGTLFLAVFHNLKGDPVIVEVDACTAEPCLHFGTCSIPPAGMLQTLGLEDDTKYLCDCSAGWGGDVCQIELWRNNTVLAAVEEEPEEPLAALTAEHTPTLVILVLLVLLVGGVWGRIWMWMLFSYPDRVVHWTLGSAITIQLSLATALLAGGNGFGLLVILSAGFSFLFIVFIRAWIPFATVMIRTATEITREHPAMLRVSMGAALLQLIWVVIWATATAGAAVAGDTLSIILLFTNLFWSIQVIKNVVHVSCAGVAASWYFKTEDDRPTLSSLKRACTTSFGSICLGSLLVAVLRALWMVVPRRRTGQSGLVAVACGGALSCVLAVLSRLVEVYNHFAFTFMAIYGHKFSDAGKATWYLILLHIRKSSQSAPLVSSSI